MQERRRQRLRGETRCPMTGRWGVPRGATPSPLRQRSAKAARRMYHALSPEAGHFFDEMVRHDLLDVAGSPNKILRHGLL